MLDNFREIYEKELGMYDDESGDSLGRLVLGSKYVRAFVYEVCKNCITHQSTEVEACEYFIEPNFCGAIDGIRIV